MLKSSDSAFRYARNCRAKILLLFKGAEYRLLKDERLYL